MESERTVGLAMEIELPQYDNSLVLNYLFQEDALSYMKVNQKPPKPWPPFHSDLTKYNEAHKKADQLCKQCDEWSEKIGFYDGYGESNWKYYILLKNPIRYEKGLEINNFTTKKGKSLTAPPQSWCYIV